MREKTYSLLICMQIGTNIWKSVWMLLKDVDHRSTTWSSCASPEELTKRFCIFPQRYIFSKFIAALFTITGNWKQSRCASTDEWIVKMWHIYTVGHSSADERNEILIKFQVNENSYLLSKVTQTYKNKQSIILSHELYFNMCASFGIDIRYQ